MDKEKGKEKKKKGNLDGYDKKEKELKQIHHHLKANLTLGQKASDKLTTFAGSWTFIFLLLVFMAVWIALNMIALVSHWDPWPFIILNLILSCLAAIQAPIILMSQNREAERDRVRAERDFLVNRKAEKEIKVVQSELKEI